MIERAKVEDAEFVCIICKTAYIIDANAGYSVKFTRHKSFVCDRCARQIHAAVEEEKEVNHDGG